MRAPTLFVAADHDVVRGEHVVEMVRLTSRSRLLVLPAAHGDYLGGAFASNQDERAMRATVPWLLRFLDDVDSLGGAGFVVAGGDPGALVERLIAAGYHFAGQEEPSEQPDHHMPYEKPATATSAQSRCVSPGGCSRDTGLSPSGPRARRHDGFLI